MKINNRDIKFSSLLLVIFCLVFTRQVQAQDQLDKYLTTAGENNPELKAIFNEYMAALEQVPQVGTLPDPQLAFGIFLQPIETRVGAQRFNASISQMFPWFGTLDAKENVATEMAKAKYEDFKDAKLKLFREVGMTYNDLYYIERSIEITEGNLQLLASFKELARVNFESGKTGFVNVLRVEMEEQELMEKLELLKDTRIPVKAKFEQLLNTQIQETIDIPDSLWREEIVISKSAVIDSIFNNSPKLRRLDHQQYAFENQQEVAKKMGLPSFNLGVNYVNVAPRSDLEMSLPGNGKDAWVFPQVGISIPLYRKKYKAMEQEATLKQEAVVFKKENTANELTTEVENLYKNYQDAIRRIDLYDNLSDIAERSLNLLQTEFSTGDTDFEEILRMERKVLNYHLELEKARAELNSSVYSINYLMGK
ncbi:TolC family protein [Cyclobacterium marinum]|uniref:TolC family protein n=1 Tax=Cyclobacterium marinum TaxID=104 RepID=UPI0011ED3CBA|nr:TolC family protein [Cyclobacterium marinum]MBI0398058.1 TolC family protein [Cyclobacterium marinum]